MTGRSLIAAVMIAVCIMVAGLEASALADDFECMIEPYQEVKVSSQVPGIIEEVLVERGDIVKKGQVLARLKSGVEKADVEFARAQVEFSKRKLERSRDLYEKKLISDNDKDELETEIRKGESQLQQAIAKLELRIIRSTVDGVVVKRDLSSGEYVGDKPILTVAQINPLNVEAIVPVRKLGSVALGMRAEVRPESPVGGVYAGTVVIVDRVIDAASGTFGVRAELPNPSLSLPAGLKCKVRFFRK